MPKLLVTTALEHTWGDTEPLVYLGEWCRLYDRREVWAKRTYEVVPNHWDDRKKLRRDYDYLKQLHDSLLVALVPAMNRHHQLDRPLRFWQMILDPWLLTYVAVMWDRWECLRVGFERHDALETVIVEPNAESGGFHDYSDFIQKIFSDSWNYDLCRAIIAAQYSQRCVLRRVHAPRRPGAMPSFPELPPLSIQHRCAKFIDGLFAKMWSRSRIVIVEGYFSRASLVMLNVSLRQWPRLFLNEFDWPAVRSASMDLDAKAKSRDAVVLEVAPQTEFEGFLLSRLAGDIPHVYVEGFPALQARSRKIGLRPEVIVTATAHWGNELFKLWSAERVLNGAKLVSMEHGGAFPPAFGAMSFEEDISDARIVWVRSYNKKHVTLPAPKVIPIKSSRRHLAIVSSELPRYNYRADSMPKSAQSLSCYEMVCELHGRLQEEARAHLRIKPHPDCGWSTRQRFIDALGKDQVSDERSYYRFLSSARLVVCTYPQTTFSEAMGSGLPSLLLYPEHLWETEPNFGPVLDSLRSAQIVFHDSASAAAHINSIWADPERWWNSVSVVRARNEFHRQMLPLDGNWRSAWTQYLKGLVPSA